MKKIIAVAALSIFALASCKKDYTCECSFDGGTSTSTIKAKKKDAETFCDTNESNAKAAGFTNVSCTLK